MRVPWVVGLLNLAAIATPAQASEWWFVESTGTKPRRAAIFMDKASIVIGADKARAWQQTYYEDRSDSIASDKRLIEYDCASRSYRTISYINYNSRGETIVSRTLQSADQRIESIAPDTVIEAQMKFACGAQTAAIKLGAITNIEAVGQAALDFIEELKKTHP